MSSLSCTTTEAVEAMPVPEQCLTEAKARDKDRPMATLLSSSTQHAIFQSNSCSSLTKLLRVTVYILKFVNTLRHHHSPRSTIADRVTLTLVPDDINLALTYWLRVSQSPMPEMERFKKWTDQFGLFQDSSGLWRCGGR